MSKNVNNDVSRDSPIASQVFVFKGQNMKLTIKMLFTSIQYVVTPGPQ